MQSQIALNKKSFFIKDLSLKNKEVIIFNFSPHKIGLNILPLPEQMK